MEPQELMACEQGSTMPPSAAQLAIATIQQLLMQGATPEQVARAQAELARPRSARQGSLPL